MSTYIISGYLTYIIIGLVILTVFIINIKRLIKNKSEQTKIVLITNIVSAVFMAIDVYRWIKIGYHEEVTIFDTVGPLLVAISIYGTIDSKKD